MSAAHQCGKVEGVPGHQGPQDTAVIPPVHDAHHRRQQGKFPSQLFPGHGLADVRGQLHFDPSKAAGKTGFLSEMVKAKGVIFRQTEGDYRYEFHTAPRRQYVVNLEGEVEIEAWHESFGRQSQKVKVKPRATVEVAFNFKVP